MPPRKKTWRDRILLGVYKPPPPLDCGCPRDNTRVTWMCNHCNHTRCADHAELHDSAACGEGR